MPNVPIEPEARMHVCPKM
jgi:hypothetical protein